MNTIIINGGDPLAGCPNSPEEAILIQDKLNNTAIPYFPTWSFDCGYKLDFDGDILSISSRFYPPKEYYGPNWNGTVSLHFMGDTIREQKFDCKDLDELKREVEAYVLRVFDEMRALFNQNNGDKSNE